ncbi:MAG: ABC-F family ATP-binding cassette domain-containing protein [Candidatus Gottesmanbacteria bacterium]
MERRNNFRVPKEKLNPTYLTVSSVDIAYGMQQVLDGVSISMHKSDYAALVGQNGAGKTTLMRIIAGLEQPDKGTVSIPNNLRVAYIPQAITDLDIDSSISVKSYFLQARGLDTIQEQMLRIERDLEKNSDRRQLNEYGTLQYQFHSRGGYEVEHDATVLLSGVGLHIRLDQAVKTLSGGQKTKLFFAHAIYSQPDILLMDEPTNHIDEKSRAWLGRYLKRYPGAILVISHDPDFLNPFSNRILELHPSEPGVTEYRGNYDQYRRLKNERIRQLTSESRKTQIELLRQRDIAARLQAGSRAQSGKSREKLVKRLEKRATSAPKETRLMAVRFEIERPSGQTVISTKDLGKIYDEALLTYPDMQIQRGHNTAILGPVGAGKSTLMKLLSQRINPDQGTITYGSNIQLGYYDQEHAELDFHSTILEELHRARPNENDQRLRMILGHFLFSGDAVFKPISVLSEGEKSRVALAKLAATKNNLLILDEPTNHLDIQSKKRLLEALQGFEGTIIVVTHDRDLLDGLDIYQRIYLPEGRIEMGGGQ